MGYYSSTLQKGSKGSEVKKWQEFLNTQGYNLSVDGDFGDNTYAATTDWQSKNGLGVDGIVGANTWGKAGFSNINTPVSAPTLDPLPTAPTYDTTSWDDTDKGKETAGAYNAAKDAVTNYGDFTWDRQGDYDALYDKYTNRAPFSYDFNADALYQQYKDMYMQQGKMAMQDTMGQAAAMTGGYGNSYAATVGNQAYQGYLGKLNEVIPELYQLALNKHNQEGQDMLNALGLMESDRTFDYGMYTDKYGRLTDAYGIASDDYYKGAEMFYTEQGNKNSIAGQEFTDAMSIWNANSTNAWEQAKWDEDQRRYELDRAEDEGGGYKVVTDGNGKPTVVDGAGNPVETDIPSSVLEKAGSFESNVALGNYLDGLIASGVITEDQAYEVLAMYEDSNEKFIKDEAGNNTSDYSYRDMVTSTSGWTVVDDGGVNWFWGVDNNAIVKAPNGEQIRLDELVDKLVSEGVKKSDAKNFVKKLQKNLGI